MFDTLWDMGHFRYQLLIPIFLTSKVLMIINFIYEEKNITFGCYAFKDNPREFICMLVLFSILLTFLFFPPAHHLSAVAL